MIYVRQAQRPEPKFLGTIRPIHSLNIIVAVDSAGGFGKDGKIPWHFKEDFKNFKEITKESICIMGRKTYDDMLEMMKARKKDPNLMKEILPGRTSIVLTRNKDYTTPGATTAFSLMEAVQGVDENDTRPIFILGGQKVFVEALTWVNRVYMTIVDDYYDCDKFFPVDYVHKNFSIVNSKKAETAKLKFVEYERKK